MLSLKSGNKNNSVLLKVLLVLLVLATCVNMAPAVYADEEEEEPVIEIIHEDYSITLPTQTDSQPETSINTESYVEEIKEEIATSEVYTETAESETVYVVNEVKEQETISNYKPNKQHKKENKNVNILKNNKKEYEAALNAGKLVSAEDNAGALYSVFSLKDAKLMLINLRLLSVFRRTANN